MVQGASFVDEYFPKEYFLDGCIKNKGETPCVRYVHPLVSPAEGDGDLRLGVGDGVFCVDGEHLAGDEFSISSILDGGKAPEDSGDHFIMILEGVVVVPRWSAISGSIVIVVVLLLGLELLSQAKAVLHLVLVVLVEGAQAFKDFLVLLIIVSFGARFINGGDDVVCLATAILTSFGPF